MSDTVPGALDVFWAPKRIGDSLGNAIGGASKTIFNAAKSFEENAGTWDRNTATYAKGFLPELESINKFFGRAESGASGVTTSVNRFFANTLNSVREQVGGYSEFMAGTVADLSGIVNNPLDLQIVSNSAASILNRVFPGSSNTINKSMQNLHLDKLAKAPGLLFSGLQRLARAIDNLLSIPIAFISSIYYGVIGFIKRIGDELNNLLKSFQQFIFDFLDIALGGQLKEILQLLTDIGTLAGQIGGIASIFGGANIVTGFATQITTFTNQINSVVTNPLDTVLGVLPSNISEGYSEIMNGLQNPESLINQFLPDDLSAIFSKITSITGFGFNGNMGYSLAGLLEQTQGGVINSILTDFAAQYNILAPLLGGGMNGGGYETPISYNPKTDNGYIQGKRYAFNPDTKIYELVQ